MPFECAPEGLAFVLASGTRAGGFERDAIERLADLGVEARRQARSSARGARLSSSRDVRPSSDAHGLLIASLSEASYWLPFGSGSRTVDDTDAEASDDHREAAGQFLAHSLMASSPALARAYWIVLISAIRSNASR